MERPKLKIQLTPVDKATELIGIQETIHSTIKEEWSIILNLKN
jgi:hypothetical protein